MFFNKSEKAPVLSATGARKFFTEYGTGTEQATCT